MLSFSSLVLLEVSEELSSVETFILLVFSSFSCYQFQKNLVVWKPKSAITSRISPSGFRRTQQCGNLIWRSDKWIVSPGFRRTQQCGNVIENVYEYRKWYSFRRTQQCGNIADPHFSCHANTCFRRTQQCGNYIILISPSIPFPFMCFRRTQQCGNGIIIYPCVFYLHYVSEELSSVETLFLYIQISMKSCIVSEELSSVETNKIFGVHRRYVQVSEELSSVETHYPHLHRFSISRVSEELSSVETIIVLPLTIEYIKVSEELSSVETQFKMIFSRHTSLSFRRTQQCGNPSSSKTVRIRAYSFRRTQQCGNEQRVCEQFGGRRKFQKNLVVWKLWSASLIVSLRSWFQKNLVVWKQEVIKPESNERPWFQKNLVVWKLFSFIHINIIP